MSAAAGSRFLRLNRQYVIGIILLMTITILSVLFAVTLVFLALSRMAVERIETHHYLQRADFFQRYPVQQGDIVFLGDSITDGGCWEELFPGVPLKNRGINADNTRGVLERLDDILRPQPRAIFLLIGTNDLPWYTYLNDRAILHTYNQILDRCRALAPDAVVHVQSLLPRQRIYAARILRINAHLETLASRHGYPFINLFPAFADRQGALRADLTNDHLHLMAEGYALWVSILKPYIEQLHNENVNSA